VRRRAWAAGALLAGVTVVLEVAYRHSAHAAAPWHGWPAFDLAYGFLGCALIVVASKGLGRAFLQKPETFYREDE
jgi:hypothetical protein